MDEKPPIEAGCECLTCNLARLCDRQRKKIEELTAELAALKKLSNDLSKPHHGDAE